MGSAASLLGGPLWLTLGQAWVPYKSAFALCGDLEDLSDQCTRARRHHTQWPPNDLSGTETSSEDMDLGIWNENYQCILFLRKAQVFPTPANL